MVVALIIISIAYVFHIERDKIVFIDVGQGDATYMRIDGVDILIDTGKSRDILFSLGEIMPLYDKKIEYLIITHFGD